MSIARAWYVMCDLCRNPSEISTESGKQARALARSMGWKRRKVDGRMCDICPWCEEGDQFRR